MMTTSCLKAYPLSKPIWMILRLLTVAMDGLIALLLAHLWVIPKLLTVAMDGLKDLLKGHQQEIPTLLTVGTDGLTGLCRAILILTILMAQMESQDLGMFFVKMTMRMMNLHKKWTKETIMARPQRVQPHSTIHLQEMENLEAHIEANGDLRNRILL